MATSASPPDAPRQGGRTILGRLLRFVLILIVGLVVAAGLLTVLAMQGLLSGQVAKLATEKLGRNITFGDARFVPSIPLKIRLKDVEIANPPGMSGPSLLKAAALDADLKLNWKPLFTFNPELENFALESPEINIQTTAEGRSNLDFGGNAGGETGAALWPAAATITNGKLTVTPADGTEPLVVEAIDASLESDRASGKTTGKGKLTFKGEPLDFDATFADLKIATSGLPTGLTVNLSSPKLTANLAGDAVLGAKSQFSGDAKLSTPSLNALIHWLNPSSAAKDTATPASLDGKIRARSGEVVFTGAAVDVGGTKATLDGTLALGGERPKLTGTVAMPLLDLSALTGVSAAAVRSLGPAPDEEPGTIELVIEPDPDGLADQLRAIETGTSPPPRAAPQAAPPPEDEEIREEARSLGASAAAAVWSSTPIDLTSLRLVDLDVGLSADAVAFGDLDIKNARVKTKLDNGQLAADVDDLDISGGKAKGKIAINAAAAAPTTDVALTLTGVAAEPIVTQFTGKPFLSGTSNAEIKVKASGANPDALAASLEGSAKFKMGQGSFRGIDVRKEADNFCLSELLGGYVFGTKKTFQVDLNKKTAFETLEADYSIRKGVLKTGPGLAVGGKDVEITSRGEVNVARKLVNQNVRLKVVPPPKLPTLPVIISGSWSKLTFKLDTSAVDWLAVLNSAFLGCDASRSIGPQAVTASPEAVPDNVRQAIEGVLASQAGASALNDDGKAALRSLAGDGAASPQP